MLTNKAKGRKLEDYVADYLKELDPKARPTKGSGSQNEIADVLNKYFYIECKYRETDSITVKKDVWEKLCNEIKVGSLKTPAYILENKDHMKWVMLEFKDFMSLIRRVYGS